MSGKEISYLCNKRSVSIVTLTARFSGVKPFLLPSYRVYRIKKIIDLFKDLKYVLNKEALWGKNMLFYFFLKCIGQFQYLIPSLNICTYVRCVGMHSLHYIEFQMKLAGHYYNPLTL